MVLAGVHYIFLGVIGFAGVVWALSSMGVIKSRNHDLHSRKHQHIDSAIKTIELTYEYMDALPEHTRAKVFDHLDNHMLGHALETARAHHDVYHFFKNFS